MHLGDQIFRGRLQVCPLVNYRLEVLRTICCLGLSRAENLLGEKGRAASGKVTEILNLTGRTVVSRLERTEQQQH